jgi:hypothetical protein
MDSLSDKELEGLTRDLRALAGAPLLVPKRVDDAVLGMARRQTHRRRRWRFVAGAAAAAVLLVIGAVWLLSVKAFAPRAPSAEGGNGVRPDVLDLLALALKAESRAPLDAKGELPHEGIVNEKEVRALARNIVRVTDAQGVEGGSEDGHDGRCTIDIFVDSGAEPLAAYEVEFNDPTGRIRIIGVEGGDPAAFKAPPYYDPAALGRGRIVLAAYSTGSDLPTGKVRVARLLVVGAAREPSYLLRLCAAGTSDGNKVPAKLFMAQRRNEFNRGSPAPKGAGGGAVSDVAPALTVGIVGRG